MSDLRELLPLYALGVLDADEAAQVEAAIAKDPSLAAELRAYETSAHDIVSSLGAAPDAYVKTRLLASVGLGAYEKYSTKMADLFDVSVDRARELLSLIDRPSSWEPAIAGMEIGVRLVHFDGGPRYADADCGYVLIQPGASFPVHTHLGEEKSLILAGRLRDRRTGKVYVAGDEIEHPHNDVEHDVVCEGDEPVMYAARATNGLAVNGVPQRPIRH
jgi:putative transcriptional regulator